MADTTTTTTTTYSGSQAQAGRGTTISINGSLVGEMTDVPPALPKWNTAEVTNLDSGDDAEYLTTIRKSSTFTAKGNRVPGDAGQVAAFAAYKSGSRVPCIITLPKTSSQATSGDTYSFNVLVLSCDFSVQVEKAIDFSVELQITGAVTYAAGS